MCHSIFYLGRHIIVDATNAIFYIGFRVNHLKILLSHQTIRIVKTQRDPSLLRFELTTPKSLAYHLRRYLSRPCYGSKERSTTKCLT